MNIEKLISIMTLEEKASLCSGENKWKTQSIRRLKIPSRNMFDGPSGIRKPLDENEFGINELCCEATCFPTGSALAATWNRSLLKDLGIALAIEAKAADVNILLGPGINMKRSPLGGRNFEYFSEDPYLTSELAVSLIEALQSKGVGACIKHFVCNNSEYERMSMSSEVEERALREIYLKTFENVIMKVQPWAIMAAYNKLNGEHCTENKKILKEILRDEWGYENLVISDWGAVDGRVKGMNATLDIEMPGPSSGNDKKIIEAVLDGELDEAVLDETIRRILSFVNKSVDKSLENVDYSNHHDLARKIANESITLLKNDGILPLNPDSNEKIAVIGQLAKESRYQGGGSSRVQAKYVDIPLDCLLDLSGYKGERIEYSQGYELESDDINHDLISDALEISKSADKVVVFLGLDDLIESEGYDRRDMKLPKNQVKLIEEVIKVNTNVIVMLHNGSSIEMHGWDDEVRGIVQVWLSGQAMGSSVADVLFGKVNPSGKLSETFPKKLEHNPAYFNYPGTDGQVMYNESIFVGYRYYDKKEMPVQFPFGHGLSYTTFSYGDINLAKEKIHDSETVEVTIKIENTGRVSGAEVVQLYLKDDESHLIRPVHELKGFEKVFLEPGEKKEIRFELSQRDFSYYNPNRGGWNVESGEFTVRIGSSSRDIRSERKLTVISTQRSNMNLSYENLVKDWLATEEGAEKFWKVLAKYKLEERVRLSLIGENKDMVLGMPVKKVFYFEPNLAELMDEILKELIM